MDTIPPDYMFMMLDRNQVARLFERSRKISGIAWRGYRSIDSTVKDAIFADAQKAAISRLAKALEITPDFIPDEIKSNLLTKLRPLSGERRSAINLYLQGPLTTTYNLMYPQSATGRQFITGLESATAELTGQTIILVERNERKIYRAHFWPVACEKEDKETGKKSEYLSGIFKNIAKPKK